MALNQTTDFRGGSLLICETLEQREYCPLAEYNPLVLYCVSGCSYAVAIDSQQLCISSCYGSEIVALVDVQFPVGQQYQCVS